MPTSTQSTLALAALVAVSSPCWAQMQVDDPPAVVAPRPASPTEQARREAMKLYVEGLLCEHEDRLLDATRALERAAQLEPGATAIYRALVPLYLTLERADDALTMTRKVVELDPSDAPMGYVLARQLRARGQLPGALAALRKAADAAKDDIGLLLQVYHDLGVVHERLETLPAAIAALEHAARLMEQYASANDGELMSSEELHRRAAETYERLGTLHARMAQYEQAIECYQRAQAKLPGGAARLNLALADVSRRQGYIARALEYADAFLRLQPQGTEAYELKRLLLIKLNRASEIVPWLEDAAAKDRHNVALRLLLARQYVENGQPARAEQIYLGLAEQSPTNETYRRLFTLYRSEPRLGMVRGLRLLDSMVRRSKSKEEPAASNPAPAHARAMITVLRAEEALARELVWTALPLTEARCELQPETLHLLAALADRNRQSLAAERHYRHCLTHASKQTEPLVYGGLINVLWRAKKYEEIVALCRQGLKAAPASQQVMFHGELARALAQLGQTDSALREADTALRLTEEPQRLAMRHLRLRILSQAGRAAQAEKECLALLEELKLSHEILQTRYLLSHVYSNARQFERAEEQLQICLKLDPTNASVHNDLGYLWADQNKNLKEAEELIRRALELDRHQRRGLVPPGTELERDDRDNAAYVDSLGWVLFRRGQFDAARQELERAAALPDGDDPVVWDHLGDVYRQLGRPGDARNAWQKAVHLYGLDPRHRIDPRYQTLRQKLRQLEKRAN